MFYGNDVQDTRQVFFLSWKKYQQGQPLQPLEQQLIDVILMHPEYHALLSMAATPTTQTYFPELGQTNPFLHMGLHLAIREQVATDRPTGIATIYHTLIKKYQDIALVEHLLMEHLAECLWHAQRHGSAPDEKRYLQTCREL